MDCVAINSTFSLASNIVISDAPIHDFEPQAEFLQLTKVMTSERRYDSLDSRETVGFTWEGFNHGHLHCTERSAAQVLHGTARILN